MSNSDLKRLYKRAGYSFEEPENLDRIFEFGTLFHNIILEPLKANHLDPDYELAKEMARRYHKDAMCCRIMQMHDLRIEHEFYRHDVYGFKGKCKADGESKSLDLILELKGLSVENERAFLEAVDRFDYDQGAAWYINTSKRKRVFIAAVSKKNTTQLFKKLVERDDKIFRRGDEKIIQKQNVIYELVRDLNLDMAG